MAERVIWERTIDEEAIAHRTAWFQKYFGIAAVVAFVIVLLVAGFSNALGSLIPIAIVGAIWGYTVRIKNLSDRANPVMTLDGGVIVLGRSEVFVEDVYQFTTLATSIQTSLFGKYSRIQLGKAVFRTDIPGTRRDPQLTEFGWPGMDADGIESVREALEPILKDKWVEPVDLVAQKDLPRRTRRTRLG